MSRSFFGASCVRFTNSFAANLFIVALVDR